MHAQTPQKSGAETEKREEPNPLLSWWSSIVLVPYQVRLHSLHL